MRRAGCDRTLPYLDKRVKKSGRTYWYFRHPAIERTAVPGQPGEPGFHREYTRLLSLETEERIAAKERSDERSLRWLSEAYEASDEWEQLAEKTRTDYSRELRRLKMMAGDLPFARLTAEGIRQMRKQVKADVVASREQAIASRIARDQVASAAGRPVSRRKPPKATSGARTADYFKSVLSALLSWAVEHEHLAVNPADRIRKLHRRKNVEGHVPWTETQIAEVLRSGPRWIVDGVIVGLYTGQRLGDCMRMTKRDAVGPDVRVRQQKTGTLVDLPAAAPLAALIARRLANQKEDDIDRLVVREDGKAYSERLFSDHLRVLLNSLGYDSISFHGLRYAAAGRLNAAGCTVATISSIIGHSTHEMAMKYLSGRENQASALLAMDRASEGE